MADLFDASEARAPKRRKTKASYTAKDIEVLEGLEPVRRRPGMYIGGTDDRALHHLAAEVIDNAMDEVVNGHASRIDVDLADTGVLTVTDNGRGIPTDSHPKFKSKSALEVIMTTLHAGGKFGGDAYETTGGLNGVGLSVVNALSDKLDVEVNLDGKSWTQTYARGKPKGKLTSRPGPRNRRGTTISFHPDPEIFGENRMFDPGTLFRLARSKAYLEKGALIRWACAKSLLKEGGDIPEKADLHFPGGLGDYVLANLDGRDPVTEEVFAGTASLGRSVGRVEWAVAWPNDEEGSINSYCNAIPTIDGGSHETGVRNALTRGLKSYGEMINNKRAQQLVADDVVASAVIVLSIFLKDPQFHGQTKERLTNAEVTKQVESAIKDHFDHWLSGSPPDADKLLDWCLARADERMRRRQEREVNRKSAVRKLRLPGKLTDCARAGAEGTEIFLVEGDSAGGSAKQARRREFQAILPLRGKILNVASANAAKMNANVELMDIIQALGCGMGAKYREDDLRYDKVVIMTDADVDGAHIASLLMTFFYTQMTQLIADGHLYLAVPPLYRLSQGGKVVYARDDAHRKELEATELTGKGKIDVSRFKGLGEMSAAQLRETTMDPPNRSLFKVTVPDDPKAGKNTEKLVERLMGRKPEGRFTFIQQNAEFVTDLDI